MYKSFVACRTRGLCFGECSQFLHTLGLITLLVSAMFMLMGINDQALSFTTNPVITGQIDFDNDVALADGNVSQTGSFSVTAGGTTTTSTFSGTTVSGDDPLSGTLTNIGDGFGIAGTVNAAFESEFEIGIDIDPWSITNNSATTPYRITFNVNFSNVVDSGGPDAYADSEFTIKVGGSEVFFSDVISDTVNGNEIGGNPTGDFGGSVNDIDLISFKVLVDPMTTVGLTGAWSLEGGVFESSGFASAAFDAAISVENVAPVPLPGTLILLGTGLAGLVAIRRRRKIRG